MTAVHQKKGINGSLQLTDEGPLIFLKREELFIEQCKALSNSMPTAK
jgi:hypothetical protein